MVNFLETANIKRAIHSFVFATAHASDSSIKLQIVCQTTADLILMIYGAALVKTIKWNSHFYRNWTLMSMIILAVMILRCRGWLLISPHREWNNIENHFPHSKRLIASMSFSMFLKSLFIILRRYQWRWKANKSCERDLESVKWDDAMRRRRMKGW